MVYFYDTIRVSVIYFVYSSICLILNASMVYFVCLSDPMSVFAFNIEWFTLSVCLSDCLSVLSIFKGLFFVRKIISIGAMAKKQVAQIF
jgi:hypothetical protein